MGALSNQLPCGRFRNRNQLWRRPVRHMTGHPALSDNPQFRSFPATNVGNQGAAWVKRAAAWRVDRVRYLTLRWRHVTTECIDARGRGQQHLCIGMTRRFEQRLGVSLFNQTSEVQNPDAIGHVPDNRQVMANEQVRQPQPILEIRHQVQHLRLHRNIECRCRLITDDEIRFRG